MIKLQNYLELDCSYESIYINNNHFIKNEKYSVQNLFYNICSDVDIVLNALNISASKSGYRYWKDAVFIYITNSSTSFSICKDIYPAIAMKYSKTIASVEKAMRSCFEDVMYQSQKKGGNYISDYLYNYLLFPHNSELLLRIVELIVSNYFQNSKEKFLIIK